MQSLDARGLACPLPVLKAQKRLKSMAKGEQLEVLADDPRAAQDFQEYAKASGNPILSLEDDGSSCKVLLEKG